MEDEFDVGYFEGRATAAKDRKWIICEEDLSHMYASFGDDQKITLWCDGKGSKRKKRSHSISDEEAPVSKRAKKEAEVNELAQKLSAEHESRFSQPQYKLWARMIASGQWSSHERPPNIPLFTGESSRPTSRKEKGSTAEVLADAAIHVLDHLRKSEPTTSTPEPASQDQLTVLSPGKKVSIRSQYLSQLRDLQKLREDGTLNDEEFAEEKARILQTLRAMQ